MELIIHFLAVLVLARILSPEDIGTYSVAAFLMALLHTFRDFGVVQYLIQEQDLTSQKIRSCMGVAIMLALTVATVLLVSSGLIARFYDNPAIERILWVMAGSFAVSPFGSVLGGLFRREMQLKKIFFVRISSTLCHVAVAISCAMHGYGALSLAWANFAGILSYGIAANLMRNKGTPWLPRFTNIKTILSFGSIAAVGNAANTAGTNVPDLIVGKVMDMAAVGYLSRANGLVQLFTRFLTDALLPLILPYYAQIRRQGDNLAEHYQLSVVYLTALAWPFFAAMMLMSYPIVRTLYGTQWDASVPLVELLSIAGAVSSISMFAGHVMVANGQVRNATISQLLSLPFRVATVYIASRYGLLATAIALIFSECLTLGIVSHFVYKTIDIGLGTLLLACRKSVVVALCTAVVPLAVRILWDGEKEQPWIPLAIGIAGAGLGWIIGVFVVSHPLKNHLLSLRRPASV